MNSILQSALRLFIGNQTERIQRRVPLDDLAKSRDGLFALRGENKPFTGIGLRWHSNGELAEEAYFRYGAPHGPWTTWYQTGSLLDHHNFESKNRIRSSETWYRGGLKHGMETTWHNNGHRASQGEYHDGLRHGLQLRWHANGASRSEIPYENGAPVDGTHRLWRASGKLEEEAIFRNGQKRRRKTWDPAGRLLLDAEY